MNQPGSDYQSLPTQLPGDLGPAGYMPQQAAGHVTHPAAGYIPQHTADHITHQAAGYMPQQAAGHMTHQAAHQAAGHVTYQATSHVSSQAANYMHQQAAGHMTDQTAGSALMTEQPSIKLDLAADDSHTQYVHNRAPGRIFFMNTVWYIYFYIGISF